MIVEIKLQLNERRCWRCYRWSATEGEWVCANCERQDNSKLGKEMLRMARRIAGLRGALKRARKRG